MHRLNWLFTCSSLVVLLVTAERYSFTTKILLHPGNFLRLHEFVQMNLIILLTVILPFLLLRDVSGNFELVKKRTGFWWMLLFLIGVYFYATGNGVHEIGSFFFNQYCDTKNFSDILCTGFFINDYYYGNILYFIGGTLMILPLLFLEHTKQFFQMDRRNMVILYVNGIFYSLAIFAYSAFDRVAIGLIYSLTIMVVSDILLFHHWKKRNRIPVILYTSVCYTLGALGALYVWVF